MSAVTITTPANIRAHVEYGATVVPGVAGSTVTVGSLVALASDGQWDKADGDQTQALARAQGICVATYDGETSAAANSAISICIRGPVTGFDSLTAGNNYYLSDTAGAIDTALGTYDRIIGWGMQIGGEVALNVSVAQGDPSSA